MLRRSHAAPEQIHGASFARAPRFGHARAAAAAACVVVLTASVEGRAGEPDPPNVPLAGYRGVFYLKNRSGSIRLYPQGRLHIDGGGFAGRGVSELPLGVLPNEGLALRRARAEASGEVGPVQFTFQLEAGRSVLENTTGARGSLDCTPSASGAYTCTEAPSSVQGAQFRAAVINGYVNYRSSALLNLQAGQFRIPFGHENRTSVNFLPFHDRALAVRMASGTTGRELGGMVWGDSPYRFVSWAVGAFSGDGSDRPNVDGRFDFIGRTTLRPLGDVEHLQDVHVGFSARAGSRNPRKSAYDINALTTQSGFAFFRSSYIDSQNRRVHIMPADLQRAVAIELYVPYGKVELAAEYIYMTHDTREAADGAQLVEGGTARSGRLQGGGFYAWLGYWLIGGREMLPTPGDMKPLHVDFKKAPVPRPTRGLEVIARYEQVRLRYRGALRGGTDDPRTPSGSIAVDGLGLAANAWLTKHLRVSLDYLLYTFPESRPLTASQPGGPTQTSAQRARGPAQFLLPGTNTSARDSAEALHEISLRVGAQF